MAAAASAPETSTAAPRPNGEFAGQPGYYTVKVGDTVSAGDTLLIIEAMKTMNPVPAPRSGKIVEILVADSEPVEFGEPLVVIE